MIDPMVSLAFALHSNRGAYAALVGSRVSVGAGIPTGWQVVLDLISKVARVRGEDAGDDFAGWYQQRFGEEPDYSKLLDTLARSPAEQSALLRRYFEPTAEERARGVKVPGAAHTALAELASTGHVRFFVTTNFDRLIEQALEAAGVTPRVLSTPDSILGSPPLSQSRCTVLKLYGDYLDTRIKNTPAELDVYDEVVDELLDRIIEEHGFIVCGWSAAWDAALRRAFERTKSRRYTTYWADVVPPGEHASRMIDLLHGEFVQVEGADSFFTDIVDKLKTLGDDGGVKTESRAPTNCEHMVDGCAEFTGSLLQQAPNITVLATSQEALGIAGETVHRVPSLLVPDSAQSTVEALTKCPAVRLFVERATTVQPGFALTDENSVAVTEITRSLDGIPLAIELAAALTNVLSAEQIADRLDDSFRLLTRGRRTDLPRHKTLRGVVEWSYQLLSEPEALLFNQLSVFRGGFTLEAAEEVCSGDDLESYEVLDMLSQLVDKSLVVVEEGPGPEARYKLLEVLRLYGTERLAETGHTEDVRGRHAGYFLTMAERAEPELFTSKQVAWVNRLESDYDNFRAAMAWAMEANHGETALKIASALTFFWVLHRHVGDGQDWLERAVLHGGDASPMVRVAGLVRAALLHGKKLKDYERLHGWLEESLRLCQEEGLTEGTPEVQWVAGTVAWFEGEFESMSKRFEDIGHLLEGVEHTPMIDGLLAMTYRFEGSAAASRGDNQRATALFEQALSLARKVRSQWVVAYFLLTLGARSLDEAEYDKAVSHYKESLPLLRELNDLTGVACALAGLGNVALLQGDHEQALGLHQESLASFKDSREGSSIAFCLECLAGGVRPPGGLQELVERHNERLDLPLEEWSKEVIAEAVQRSGTTV